MKTSSYYVYQYLDPRPEKDRCVIYVGKGKGNRHSDHLIKAYNPILRRVIGRIRDCGLEPIIEVVAVFDTEAEAFQLEQALVKQHGRRDLGTGTLCNLTNGGEGTGGYRFTPQQRAHISEVIKIQYEAGLREPVANIGKWNLGRQFTVEHREKLRQAKLGTKLSPETLAKLSKARMGHEVTEETRMKISVANKGKIVTEETRRKIGDGNRGKVKSAEARQKLSSALKGKPKSPEHVAAVRAALKGKPNGRLGQKYSEETCAKISAALKGKKPSDAHRAAISEGHRRRREAKQAAAAAALAQSQAEQH